LHQTEQRSNDRSAFRIPNHSQLGSRLFPHHVKKHNKMTSTIKSITNIVSNTSGTKETQQDIASVREYDVLCGRGGLANNHPGNRLFRRIIKENKEIYQELSENTARKQMLVSSIIKAIQHHGGRFLRRQVNGKWSEITPKEARAKASQALREQDNAVDPFVGGESPSPLHSKFREALRKSNSALCGLSRRSSSKKQSKAPAVTPVDSSDEEDAISPSSARVVSDDEYYQSHYYKQHHQYASYYQGGDPAVAPANYNRSNTHYESENYYPPFHKFDLSYRSSHSTASTATTVASSMVSEDDESDATPELQSAEDSFSFAGVEDEDVFLLGDLTKQSFDFTDDDGEGQLPPTEEETPPKDDFCPLDVGEFVFDNTAEFGRLCTGLLDSLVR